jgi:CheY-like chemotaxis protein
MSAPVRVLVVDDEPVGRSVLCQLLEGLGFEVHQASSGRQAAALLAQRWILACLRNRTFFSLEDLNEAIRGFLALLNQRPFQKLPGCRESAFRQLDKPALNPLPANRHTVAEWIKARVKPDYHVEADRHDYSVPYNLAREEVEIRMTERIIEVLYRGQRVASHPRSFEVGGVTTTREHMPLPHQMYLDWGPEKIMAWGEQVGYETYCLFQNILAERPHPQVGDRVCLGIIRLEKEYPLERIEAACLRANMLGITQLKSIKSILVHGLDRLPLTAKVEPEPIQHENIRGDAYYASKEVWALPL